MRIPKHIGIIPDGNRRWAAGQGMGKEAGYEAGISPGLELLHICSELGVEELSIYGFTVDNTKRPTKQRLAFTNACVQVAEELAKEDVGLLVLGNDQSKMFPDALKPYTKRCIFGTGKLRVNLLVNYSWEWDLGYQKGRIGTQLLSADVSRIDLIIRWGGRCRLSGFLPVQSVYSDLYVIQDYWPDFRKQHVLDAVAWYDKQDVTLGG